MKKRTKKRTVKRIKTAAARAAPAALRPVGQLPPRAIGAREKKYGELRDRLAKMKPGTFLEIDMRTAHGLAAHYRGTSVKVYPGVRIRKRGVRRFATFVAPATPKRARRAKR